MSIYVLEKLKDMYTSVGASPEEIADFRCAVEQALKNGDLSWFDIHLLRLYVHGYSLAELSTLCPNPRGILQRVCAVLSSYSGYTDDYVLRLGLQRYPSLSVITAALRKQMLDLWSTGLV